MQYRHDIADICNCQRSLSSNNTILSCPKVGEKKMKILIQSLFFLILPLLLNLILRLKACCIVDILDNEVGILFKKKEQDQKFERWNKESEAGKFLKLALESGKIDPNEPPKSIYKSYFLFQN